MSPLSDHFQYCRMNTNPSAPECRQIFAQLGGGKCGLSRSLPKAYLETHPYSNSLCREEELCNPGPSCSWNRSGRKQTKKVILTTIWSHEEFHAMTRPIHASIPGQELWAWMSRSPSHRQCVGGNSGSMAFILLPQPHSSTTLTSIYKNRRLLEDKARSAMHKNKKLEAAQAAFTQTMLPWYRARLASTFSNRAFCAIEHVECLAMQTFLCQLQMRVTLSSVIWLHDGVWIPENVPESDILFAERATLQELSLTIDDTRFFQVRTLEEPANRAQNNLRSALRQVAPLPGRVIDPPVLTRDRPHALVQTVRASHVNDDDHLDRMSNGSGFLDQVGAWSRIESLLWRGSRSVIGRPLWCCAFAQRLVGNLPWCPLWPARS